MAGTRGENTCITMHKLLVFFAPLLLIWPHDVADVSQMTDHVANYSFLSLGDSYTIGESVGEADRWSVQLAGLLRKEGISIDNPAIIARTGWTTAELQDAIKASGNQKTYSLVSLLIGVNNQYRGQSADRYRTEFRTLLQTAIHFAGGKASHVFVLSIPDWGASPFATGRDKAKIAQEIDLFNTIGKEECQKAHVAFVDITPLTRSAAGDVTQFASDGLHYSGKQMKQWAEQALPVAKKLMTQ